MKITNTLFPEYPEHLRTAIEHLIADQGLNVELEAEAVELPVCTESESDAPSLIDWVAVNNFLGQLNDEDLEMFCVGDADDIAIIAQRNALGHQANLALEALFESLPLSCRTRV